MMFVGFDKTHLGRRLKGRNTVGDNKVSSPCGDPILSGMRKIIGGSQVCYAGFGKPEQHNSS